MESDYLTIEFAPHLGGTTRTFKTPKELRIWLNSERAAFVDLGTDPNNSFVNRDTGHVGSGWETVSTWNQLDGYLNDWERDLGAPPESPRSGLASLRRVVAAYKRGTAIASDSSPVHTVRAYLAQGRSHEQMLGFACGILDQPAMDHRKYFAGFIHGVIVNTQTLPFIAGDKERVSRAAQETERIQGEVEKLLAKQADTNQSLTNEWCLRMNNAGQQAEDEVAKRQLQTGQFVTEQVDLLAKLKGETDEFMRTTEAGLSDFEDRLKTEISLGYPIDHWKTKAEHHNKFFWGSLVAFVVFAVVFVGLIYWQGTTLMDVIEDHEVKMANAAMPIYGPALPGVASPPASASSVSGIPLHFLRLGILILSVTLGLWFMRFVARILLSSLHLRDDATERVVMIKTFLAFNEAKVGLSPEDVKLALASVFRPATSGLVSDDGIPPGIWDAITRLKQ